MEFVGVKLRHNYIDVSEMLDHETYNIGAKTKVTLMKYSKSNSHRICITSTSENEVDRLQLVYDNDGNKEVTKLVDRIAMLKMVYDKATENGMEAVMIMDNDVNRIQEYFERYHSNRVKYRFQYIYRID